MVYNTMLVQYFDGEVAELSVRSEGRWSSEVLAGMAQHMDVTGVVMLDPKGHAVASYPEGFHSRAVPLQAVWHRQNNSDRANARGDYQNGY